MSDRIAWLDFAKGVGIFLVVVGHAVRGIDVAGVPDEAGLLQALDQTIYAFHMPLFFLLSGVTFGMRPPTNIQPALIKRIWRLFFPLVIWTYAFLFLRGFAGNTANANGSLSDILIFPIPPVLHFWFLWALLLNIIFFSVLRLAIRPAGSERCFWIGAFFLSLLAHFAMDLPANLVPLFGHGINYSLAFTMGAVIGSSEIVRMVPNRNLAVLGFLIFSIILYASISIDMPVSTVLSGSIISLFLLLPLVTLSSRFEKKLLVQSLAFLGVISLSIYVMHTMFSATIRILLIQTGTFNLAAHLFLGVSFGVIGPVLVYLWLRRVRLLRVVGLA